MLVSKTTRAVVARWGAVPANARVVDAAVGRAGGPAVVEMIPGLPVYPDEKAEQQGGRRWYYLVPSAPEHKGTNSMKKIAFTTSGHDLDAALDPRFGRAQRFLIYDLEHQTFCTLENDQSRNAAQGAGILAAETMVKAGVDALVTGHCGPKAFKVLDAAGVTVYHCSAATVQEALHQVQGGVVSPADAADVDGHW